MKKLISCACLLLLAGCGAGEPDEPDTSRPPNILYIITDDMGYTDLGAFGSEIPTPNLDELAYAGVRMTRLYAGPACRTTRLMLMSGADEVSASEPYEGAYRNAVMGLDYATIADLLKDAGYATYIAGKWDLGEVPGYTPEVRGFDRSFVEVRGSSSYFGREYRGYFGIQEDGRQLVPEDLPDGYYATAAYTDKILEYIRSTDADQPWFAYLPYNAPHWPLQLPDDWLDRHAGRYDAGYDALRHARFEGAARAGVMPPGSTLEGFDPGVEPWSALSADEQRRYARSQEIFAGMIEYVDMSIGRIISYLEESGQLENTVIVFTTDHGASGAEYGVDTGRVARGGGPQGPEEVFNVDNRFENFGRVGSWIDKGRGFAAAATAPFKDMKGQLTEGALRAAAFVYYPREIDGGGVSHEMMTMMDLLPTFLEIAGTEHPGAGTYRDGREINGIRGRSAWQYLTGHDAVVHPPGDSFGLSQRNGGMLIRGDYKIMNLPERGVQGATSWRLYNLAEDPGEHFDIAAQHPELVEGMVAEWENFWR